MDMMPISIQKQIMSSQGKEDFDTREDKSKDIPLCRPSCCPNKSCTKQSCPLCYAKMRKYPTLCPCVNTGTF